MSKSVLCEEKDNICLVTLNEKDTRNAISPEIIKELVSILEEIDNNKNISCAILTGAGKSFSSGGNLHEINEMTENNNMSLRDIENWYRNGIQRIPMTFNKIDVPVIAAVNGHAIGAGNDLCTMCDIRIASENAKFSESFLRIGIIPGDGGSWFLPKIIGLSRATEMILTCEVLDAQKALDWGLVSHVVPQEELLNKAYEIANKIIKNPPQSIRRAKRLLRLSQNINLHTALEMAASQQTLLQMTSDHKEAIQALIEKREARYNNK